MVRHFKKKCMNAVCSGKPNSLKLCFSIINLLFGTLPFTFVGFRIMRRLRSWVYLRNVVSPG
jgi:hypothetical protein